MAQFDVFHNPRRGHFPFLVDVQADLLSRLATRVVVPAIERERYGRPITRLNPLVVLDGVELVLVFQEMAAIPATTLGEPVASVGSRRDELIEAIDLLFTGI